MILEIIGMVVSALSILVLWVHYVFVKDNLPPWVGGQN